MLHASLFEIHSVFNSTPVLLRTIRGEREGPLITQEKW